MQVEAGGARWISAQHAACVRARRRSEQDGGQSKTEVRARRRSEQDGGHVPTQSKMEWDGGKTDPRANARHNQRAARATTALWCSPPLHQQSAPKKHTQRAQKKTGCPNTGCPTMPGRTPTLPHAT